VIAIDSLLAARVTGTLEVAATAAVVFSVWGTLCHRLLFPP
jgi:hypothetical protein